MAKPTSRVLSSSHTDQVRAWRPPDMGVTVENVELQDIQQTQDIHENQQVVEDIEPPEQLPTADQIEQLQQQAYEEGFEKGKTAGFEAGHREALEEGRARLGEQVQQFDAVLSTLDAPLQQLDDQVEAELIELVINMVRQLVRREIRTDPGQIIGVVREALSILPVSSRNISVILHPEDAALVRQIYDLGDSELGWRIVEDPVLDRGGCRISTEVSQVDATLESRLANLIAPLLGSGRDLDET
ncbi:MAG: flagellar assembly protein FliH [Gammaproteobacteria bacterium]|nr:flagellar assembly protein FliH [Gammaproteobacteria bacterium]